MTEIEKITLKNLDEFIEGLKSEMDRKKITDTGKAKESLRIEHVEGENTYQIWGADYIEILATGRAGGRMPQFDIIKEWVRRKIKPDPDDLDKVAYFVYRKIQEEGTRPFRNPSYQLRLYLYRQNLQKKLAQELGTAAAADVKQILDKFLRQAIAEGRYKPSKQQ